MNKKLIKAAIDMRKMSCSPYSNYRVGAAVETQSGEIIGGCNIESSSYGLTCCAERVALYSPISKGIIISNQWLYRLKTVECHAEPVGK
ncbi:hypothetical protein Ct9H90mP29_21910 [bacterium]|nr:MAG: hypothetical protein Ct9H90mP29_21910 [bacterium]